MSQQQAHYITAFEAAYNRYKSTKRENNTALWDLCVETHNNVKERGDLRRLSEIIGIGEDTVRDWNLVGWLIEYCGVTHYRVSLVESYNLRDIWNSDALSYDHLLRTAKLAYKFEIDPWDILESLYNAANGKQDAQALERDIEERHMPEPELLQRDFKRTGKRIRQWVDSWETRHAPAELVQAGRLFVAILERMQGAGDVQEIRE